MKPYLQNTALWRQLCALKGTQAGRDWKLKRGDPDTSRQQPEN